MNHIHKSIWNERTGTFVAVSETTKSRGKQSSETHSGSLGTTLKTICASMMLAFGSTAHALPVGGQVSAGSAMISGSAGKMTVTQSTQNAAINWQSFSIGSGESVKFVQPNSSSVTLNRVLGSDPSSILGSMTANGRVFLVNPNGILFGKGASINVGGLVASTLNISDADFMAGRYKFSGKGGNVDNQGSINAIGGYVALLGGQVSNEGTIEAKFGTVALAGGTALTLDMAGDGLLNIEVNQGAVNALVQNGGLIQADGGTVLMTTRAADTLLNDAVNNSGVIEAQSIDTHGGRISLLGSADSGTVNVSGTLDASAPAGGNGGKIETSAAHVQIAPNAKITTAASQGLTGSWLIDPVDFTVASTGGDITGASLGTLLGSNSVTIQTSTGANTSTNLYGSTGTNGDIFVNDQVSWSANNTLTLNAYRNIYIDQSITSSGASGKLALQYGQGATNGVISGTTATYTINAPVSLAAGSNFSTRLGSTGTPINYTVITSLGNPGSMTGTDLQGMSGGLSGNYALGANIDASPTSGWNGGSGFAPVGTFTGNFEGLGHTISSLTINRSGNNVGLFGYGNTNGVIRDVGLVGGSFTGGQSTGPLVGYLNNGSISNSFATGSVSGSYYVGGLVGNMLGGSVSNSFATGSVTATGTKGAGGLVGIVYKLGTAPSISDSYATGKVTAPGGAGALVGSNYGGVYSNSFYETGVNGSMTGISGSADVAGTVYGMSSSAMQVQANFTSATSANGNVNPGWDFTNASWGFGNVASGTSNLNSNLPVLCTFGGCLVSVYVDPVTGSSVYGSTPGISYTLVNSSGSAYTMTNASATGTASYTGSPSLPSATSNVGSYTVTYSSGLSLTGTNAGSYVLKAYTPTSTNWTVTAAPLTVTANNATKSYDGLAYSGGNGVTYSAFVNGQNSSVLGGTLAYGGTSQNAVNAGSYTIVPSGLTSGNYSITYANGSLTVNPAALTLSASKTYDGLTTLSGSQVTLGGLVGSQTLTYTGATSNDANVATSNKYINAITLENGTNGGLASNYQLPTLNATNAPVTVNPALLTVSGLSGTNRTYNGSTTDALSGTATLNGLQNGETLTLGNTGSGTLASANAGSEAVTTNVTIANGTGLASNYTLTQPTLANVTISPAPLTVTGLSGTNRTYNGSTTDALSGTATLNGLVNGETLTLGNTGSGTLASANAGSEAVTTNVTIANGTGLASNYTLSQPTLANVTISPAPLTVSGLSGTNRTYNGSTTDALSGTATLNGLQNGETLTLGNTTTGTLASANAGSEAVTTNVTIANGTGLASNYTLSQPTLSNVTISPALLTVTASNASKTYGQIPALTGFTSSGLVNGETIGSVTETSSGTSASASVGSYGITPSAASGGTFTASNYSITYNSGSLTVNPANLIITASDASKTYGQTPTLTGFTSSGLQNNETIGSVTETSSGTAATASVAGSPYTITPSAATGGTFSASNYSITYKNGSLVVNPATLTVTGESAANKNYDGTTTATLSGGTLNGVVNGDTVTLTEAGTFAQSAVGTGITVTAADSITGSAASNYTLTQPTGLLADITAASTTTTTMVPWAFGVGGETVKTVYTEGDKTVTQFTYVQYTFDKSGKITGISVINAVFGPDGYDASASTQTNFTIDQLQAAWAPTESNIQENGAEDNSGAVTQDSELYTLAGVYLYGFVGSTAESTSSGGIMTIRDALSTIAQDVVKTPAELSGLLN